MAICRQYIQQLIVDEVEKFDTLRPIQDVFGNRCCCAEYNNFDAVAAEGYNLDHISEVLEFYISGTGNIELRVIYYEKYLGNGHCNWSIDYQLMDERYEDLYKEIIEFVDKEIQK